MNGMINMIFVLQYRSRDSGNQFFGESAKIRNLIFWPPSLFEHRIHNGG